MCETVESCRSPFTNLIPLLCIGLVALLAAVWTTTSATPPDTVSGAFIRAALGAATPSHEAIEDQLPPDWGSCAAVARVIKTAAAWPEGRLMTEDEWQSVMRVALALQRTDPELVERALIVYMVIETHYPDGGGRLEAWLKPMLILRVMFDIPEDPWKFDVNKLGLEALPCGGFPYRMREQDAGSPPTVGLPIAWSENGPRLRALRPRIGGGTRMYQPQREYRSLLSRYPYREGLQEYVDVKVTDWVSLMPFVERLERPQP